VCGSRRPSGSRIGSRRWRASPSAWPNGHEQKPDLGDADARVVIESEDEVHCSNSRRSATPRPDFRHHAFVSPRRRRILILLAAFLLEPVAMWLRGYPIGGNLVVRCRRGHLFRTLWIPGASLKALRLGWWRVQRCPVGKHWSVVTPVRESDLSRRERWLADRQRDTWIP
jgi:hypothetical protein